MRVLTYLKHFPKMLAMLMSVIFLLTSCSKDVMEEFINEDNSTEVTDPSNPGNGGEISDLGEINSTPCDYDLSTIATGETISIDCTIDLNGSTMELPENVTLDFNGGQIINGTLKFSGGKIAGELLNYQLEIDGAVTLINPNFNLYPDRWNLKQGKVSNNTANANRIYMGMVINQTSFLGAEVFKIDVLDLFLWGDGKMVYGISLPSNFNLKMTDRTHLRAQPTSTNYSTILIMMRDVKNVSVTGGYLHGERNEHTGPDNISGNLMVVKTGVNILIEDVHMSMAGSDGLDIESYRNAHDPLYVPSENIVVRNCIFDTNRRNNLAITDGVDILVENCTFLNAGVDTSNSKGTAPRYGIDIEPDIQDYSNPLQWVERVTLRNNIEKGSIGGALVVAAGKDITVEGNNFEERTAVNTAYDVKIINNPSLGGVIAGIDGVTGERNIEISGNVIQNSTPGIRATNQAVKIDNNKIVNCGVGIQLFYLKNSTISNNEIISLDLADGDGINAIGNVNNVLIENNIIQVNDLPFSFKSINNEPEEINYTFTFKKNHFKANNFGILQFSRGGQFIGNTFENGLRLDGASDFEFKDNLFENKSFYSIEINRPESENILIENNIFKSSTLPAIGGDGGNSAVLKAIHIRSNTFYEEGINLRNHNGISVEDNIGIGFGTDNFLTYRGDNSSIKGNLTSGGERLNLSVVGENNVIE